MPAQERRVLGILVSAGKQTAERSNQYFKAFGNVTVTAKPVPASGAPNSSSAWCNCAICWTMAKPRPLPGLLLPSTLKKRFKHSRAELGWNTGAVVSNIEYGFIINTVNRDFDHATGWCVADGIVDQVAD